MPGFHKKIFRIGWMGILSILPLYAQNRAASSDRIAVVDISDTTLNQVQYNAMAAALANTCRDELGFEAVSASSLASYLKNHPGVSVFEAGQVQALCRALSVDYLIVALLEKPSLAAEKSTALPGDRWRFTLRWMDGSSGHLTKIYTQECVGNIGAPETFPLRDLLKGLVEAPSIILAVDNGLTDMPPPAIWPSPMNSQRADSAATMEAADLPSYQKRGSRHWLWYVTGAAVISGGSAVLLLRNQDRPPATRTILPEPPDPPQ
jgi:hypothetical protein